MDWEKYTGKKSKPIEYGNDVVKFVNPTKEQVLSWKDVEMVDDHTIRAVGISPGYMNRTIDIQAQDDLEVFVGAQKVYPRPSPPSFDEVWKRIETEVLPVGVRYAPGSQLTVMREMFRIMYETLTQDQKR